MSLYVFPQVQRLTNQVHFQLDFSYQHHNVFLVPFPKKQ